MLLSLMLVAGLTSVLEAPTDGADVITLRRLRSADASIRATFEEGCRRSPVFAELARDVERSHFFVYVEAVPALRNGMKGALLHGGGQPQYLRIHLKRDLAPDRLIAVLAHELQHVREVVQAGISAHAAELEMLFRRIGGKRLAGGRRQQFETAAALRVGDLVAADLRKTHGAGPVVDSCSALRPHVVVDFPEGSDGLPEPPLFVLAPRARELRQSVASRAVAVGASASRLGTCRIVSVLMNAPRCFRCIHRVDSLESRQG